MSYTLEYIRKQGMIINAGKLDIGHDFFKIINKKSVIGMKVIEIYDVSETLLAAVTSTDNSIGYAKGALIRLFFTSPVYVLKGSLSLPIPEHIKVPKISHNQSVDGKSNFASLLPNDFFYHVPIPKDKDSKILCVTTFCCPDNYQARVIISPDPGEAGNSINLSPEDEVELTVPEFEQVSMYQKGDLFIIVDKDSKRFDEDYSLYEVISITKSGHAQINFAEEEDRKKKNHSGKNYLVKPTTKTLQIRSEIITPT